jgi:hypothetical protein
MKKYIIICLSFLIVYSGKSLAFGGQKITSFYADGLTEGTYVIKNKSVDKVIRPKDANTNDGTVMEAFGFQPWTCVGWNFHASGSDSFFLENVFSGKTLTAGSPEGSDAVQQTLPAAASLAPKYKFVSLGGNTYLIENQNGLCLTADKKSDGSIHIIFAKPNGSDGQKWEVEKAPDHLLGPVAKK